MRICPAILYAYERIAQSKVIQKKARVPIAWHARPSRTHMPRGRKGRDCLAAIEICSHLFDPKSDEQYS